MNSSHFDIITRSIGSRRRLTMGLGAAALLKLSDAATARKKNRRNCNVQKIKICTGNVCGKRKNNCGKTFRCTCRRGQTCLPNGSCAVACPAECPQEGGSCSCPSSGDQVCVRDDLNCELTATSCVSMADCAAGKVCAETACGPGGSAENRCVPVCHPAP